MSKMLEDAVVDATALKEAAMKNAEAILLERYSDVIKEAVDAVLDGEEDSQLADPMAGDDLSTDPMASDALPGADPMAGAPAGISAAPVENPNVLPEVPLAVESEPTDEEIEIDFDDLQKAMAADDQVASQTNQPAATQTEVVPQDSLAAVTGAEETDPMSKIAEGKQSLKPIDITQYTYGKASRVLQAAVAWLNQNKELIHRDEVDYFDSPNYWDMPRQIADKLSPEEVDFIEQETYDWIPLNESSTVASGAVEGVPSKDPLDEILEAVEELTEGLEDKIAAVRDMIGKTVGLTSKEIKRADDDSGVWDDEEGKFDYGNNEQRWVVITRPGAEGTNVLGVEFKAGETKGTIRSAELNVSAGEISKAVKEVNRWHDKLGGMSNMAHASRHRELEETITVDHKPQKFNVGDRVEDILGDEGDNLIIIGYDPERNSYEVECQSTGNSWRDVSPRTLRLVKKATVRETITVDHKPVVSGKASGSGLTMGEESDEAKKTRAAQQDTATTEELKDLKKTVNSLTERMNALRAEKHKLHEATEKLSKKLLDVNLSNARLFYANRVLSNASLNERQKVTIVENIMKAQTLEEAKAFSRSVPTSVKTGNKPVETLREATNRPHALVISESKKDTAESNPMADRWKALAGINNKEEK